MIGFDHPERLAWGAAILAIAVLYFVRLPGKRLTVPALYVWRGALARRPAWRRLRRAWPLLLAATLLTVALAEPYLPESRSYSRQVVLIVDTSTSMRTGDRLAQARRLAERVIDRIGKIDRAAILSAGATVEPVVSLTNDRERLRRGLEHLRITDGPGRLDEAVAMAGQLPPGADWPWIVVITDGDETKKKAPPTSPPDQENVVYLYVGQSAENVAVTQLGHRPNRQNPDRIDIFFELTNFGDQAVTCPLRWGWRTAEPQTRNVTLPPGKSLAETLTIDSAQGGYWSLAIDHADALAEDNQAWLYFPPVHRRALWLVTEGNPALEAALQGLPGVEPRVVATEHQLDLSDTGADTVVIFDRQVPARLPEAATILLEPTEAGPLWTLTTPRRSPDASGWDIRPTPQAGPLAVVDASQAVVEQLVGVQPTAEVASRTTPLLVAQQDAPVMLRIDRPEARPVWIFTPQLAHSDLTLHAVYPRWIAAMVREAWRPVEASWDRAVTAGETIRPAAGEKLRSLVSPDDRVYPIPPGAEPEILLDACGLWRLYEGELQPGAAPSLLLACNLLCPSQSDLRIPEGQSSGEMISAGSNGGNLAFVLLVAALLVGLLGTRGKKEVGSQESGVRR